MIKEPTFRIEHGRKIYTIETTIGCERRPPKPIDNQTVDRALPDDTRDGGVTPPYESK